MSSIRVAIVGVGNCAASLVQGVHYYADADPQSKVPGLMHVQFGPYHVRDIEFVAAFDVDAKKVGCELSREITGAAEAEFAPTGALVADGRFKPDVACADVGLIVVREHKGQVGQNLRKDLRQCRRLGL